MSWKQYEESNKGVLIKKTDMYNFIQPVLLIPNPIHEEFTQPILDELESLPDEFNINELVNLTGVISVGIIKASLLANIHIVNTLDELYDRIMVFARVYHDYSNHTTDSLLEVILNLQYEKMLDRRKGNK